MYDEIKGNASKVSPQEIDKDISTGLILTQKNDIPHDDEWSQQNFKPKKKSAPGKSFPIAKSLSNF